jgi:23S rRNA (uracil1939-C5)-methyltransferase
MSSARMKTPLYGGDVVSEDGGARLPFVLRGELVEVETARVLEGSSERVAPRCVHFGRCGGCQYQMAAYGEQLVMKREILGGLLRGVGAAVAGIATCAAEEYEYRNRIRLRVQRVDGVLRFGYNVRGTAEFLPVVMCPIAAPVLWETAEAVLRVAAENEAAAQWMDAASEVEFFVDDALAKVQMTLGCAPRTRLLEGSFAKMMQAVSAAAPQVVGAGAIAVDPRTGPTGRVLAGWGAAGLQYRVGEETYWVSRGGFFQVNRFLLPKLVELVCVERSGAVAWDLFAGVGLFSRVLARQFARLTAVEANPVAAKDLAAALKKIGAQHRAVEATTLDFLRRAVLERERPELVVMDPPRAGAGEEACALVAKLMPRTVVYVSCDPTTLARDWAVLQGAGYSARTTQLVDLFPQTFHMETVVEFVRA